MTFSSIVGKTGRCREDILGSWGHILVVVAGVERFEHESMYGLPAGTKKPIVVERWPLAEVRVYFAYYTCCFLNFLVAHRCRRRTYRTFRTHHYILKEILTDTYYKRGHVSCPSDIRPLMKHNQEIIYNIYNILYTDYFFKF